MVKKIKQADGIANKCTSRIAKSGNFAHSFFLKEVQYTFFSTDELSPVMEGDRVRFEYEVRKLRSGSRNTYSSVIQDSLRVDAPHTITTSIKGIVYILSNPSMRGLLKIGYTTRTAEERVSELSGQTNMPTAFKVEWVLPVIGDPMAVEQRAHTLLAKKKEGKEFFRTSLEEAKSACMMGFAEIHPEQAEAMDNAFSDRAREVKHRRDQLARTRKEREEAEKARNEKIAFWNSPKGKWLSEGLCAVLLHDFDYPPNENSVSIFKKLLGEKFENYLEAEISASEDNELVDWHLSVRGRSKEKRIWLRQKVLTIDDGLRQVKTHLKEFEIKNYQLCITIPVCLIDNPPDPPDSFNGSLSAASTARMLMRDSGFGPHPYALIIPSIEGVVIRADPHKQERKEILTMARYSSSSWPRRR